jgi:hypothetical protein
MIFKEKYLNCTLAVTFIIVHPEFHRNSWTKSQLQILLIMAQVTFALNSAVFSINIAELWDVSPVPKEPRLIYIPSKLSSEQKSAAFYRKHLCA